MGTFAGRQWSSDELTALWSSEGGPSEVARLAAEIAISESGGHEQAVSDTGCEGLWQLCPPPPDAFDPHANARGAIEKYEANHDFHDWTQFNPTAASLVAEWEADREAFNAKYGKDSTSGHMGSSGKGNTYEYFERREREFTLHEGRVFDPHNSLSSSHIGFYLTLEVDREELGLPPGEYEYGFIVSVAARGTFVDGGAGAHLFILLGMGIDWYGTPPEYPAPPWDGSAIDPYHAVKGQDPSGLWLETFSPIAGGEGSQPIGFPDATTIDRGDFVWQGGIRLQPLVTDDYEFGQVVGVLTAEPYGTFIPGLFEELRNLDPHSTAGLPRTRNFDTQEAIDSHSPYFVAMTPDPWYPDYRQVGRLTGGFSVEGYVLDGADVITPFHSWDFIDKKAWIYPRRLLSGKIEGNPAPPGSLTHPRPVAGHGTWDKAVAALS